MASRRLRMGISRLLRIALPIPLTVAGITGGTATALAVTAVPALAAPPAAISGTHPLTRIEVTRDLNCQVYHAFDGHPEWFGIDQCGTFLALNQAPNVFGPDGSRFVSPAFGSAYTPYSTVTQSPVTGGGGPGSPFTIVTTVDAGNYARLTQTDSYVNGEDYYTTKVTVENRRGTTLSGDLYTGGNCFLADSDFGFGQADGMAPSCTANQGPFTRVLTLEPLSYGSRWFYGRPQELWSRIGAKVPFPDFYSVDPNFHEDNAIGLSWGLYLPAGSTETFYWRTVLTTAAHMPLGIMATSHFPSSLASTENGYRIEVYNPNPTDELLHEIRVTLPPGFSYIPGSTTGATGSDPLVFADLLIWPVGFHLPPGAMVTIDFRVKVSEKPGVYFIDVAAESDGIGTGLGSVAPVFVDALADLELTKAASVPEATAGQVFSYHYLVHNLGPSEVPDAVIEDRLPPGIDFVSGPGCSGAGSFVHCVTGPIPPGVVTAVSVEVRVAPGAPAGWAYDDAVVFSPGVPSSNPIGSSAQAPVLIRGLVDLSITKAASPSAVDAGDTVKFVIDVRNAGESAADPATLYDSLPAGLIPASISGPGCNLANLICSMHIPPGATETVTLDARVADDIPGGTVLVNHAHVDAPDNIVAGGAGADAAVTVSESARLTVTKVVAAGLFAGETGVYKLVVTDHGPSAATGVVLHDTLPSELTFDPAASSTVCSGDGTVTCPVGTLQPGESDAVEIAVHVPVTLANDTSVTNAVTGTASQPNPDPAGATATVTDPVRAEVYLQIAKTATADPVTAGGPIAYHVTVRNEGPADATGLTVHDPIPPQLSGVAATVSAGTGACTVTTVVTCTFPTVAAGDTVEVTITGTVASSAAGDVISNTAAVTASQSDLNPSPSASSQTNVAATTGLAAAKVASANPAVAGGPLDYTLSVTNEGPSDATRVALHDTVPAGFTATSATASNGAACTVTGGHTVDCPDLGSLALAASVHVTVAGHLAASLAPGTLLNTATFTDAEGGTSDGHSASTVTTDSAITVTKSAAQPSVAAGDVVRWTIHVHNAGPSDATAAPVVETPDPGYSVTGLAPAAGGAGGAGAAGSCDVALLRCTVDVPAGTTVDIDVTATVHPDTPAGAITDCATFDSPQPSPGDSTGCTSAVTVTQHTDLTLAKSSQPAAIAAGQPVHYLLTVANHGPSTATGVTLTDVLPGGLSFVAAESSAGCTAAGQTVTCAVGSLEVGQDEVVDVAASAAPTVGGTVKDTASATADQPNPHPSASANTAVDAVADLAITKTGQNVYAGNDLTWTLEVTNSGPASASGAVIDSTVPAPTTFVRATSSSGSCAFSAAARTVTCHPAVIHPGDVVTVRIVTRTPPGMVPPGKPYVIVEDPATVSYAGDTDPDNNTATALATVFPLARLALTKTAAPAPLVAGELASYHATVRNDGPSDATGVTVTDTLPEGLSFDPAASDHRCSRVGDTAGMVRCTAPGALGVGHEVTFTVVALADATLGNESDVVNDSVASAVQAPPAGPAVTARARSLVVRLVDLEVTKRISASQVLAGSQFRVTILVVNHGPSAASAVVVTDQTASPFLRGALPPGDGITLSCPDRGISFRCEVPEILPGASVPFTVEVSVSPGTPTETTACDTALATSAETETPATGNHATACAVIVTMFVPVTG
jgi:large repetitive protein